MQSMITTQLLCPQSIVVGASNNTHKPGGAILKNLINGGYQENFGLSIPKKQKCRECLPLPMQRSYPIQILLFLLLLQFFVRRWWKHWPQRSRRGLS